MMRWIVGSSLKLRFIVVPLWAESVGVSNSGTAVVFGIAGLDSRKEDVAAHSDAYLRHGLGVFAVDLPGTGESPIAPATQDADRLFSAALDHLIARRDIDGSRIVVQGRSWSGYWAAKLAVTECARLCGSIMPGHRTLPSGSG